MILDALQELLREGKAGTASVMDIAKKAGIAKGLSSLLANILKQGHDEGIFVCKTPIEYAEIMLSFFVFLLDPGLFTWTDEQVVEKLKAFAGFLEKGLCAKEDSFSFLYENWTKQKLRDFGSL